MGDSLLTAFIESIEESMGVQGQDWLSWWLWEDVDKIIYDGEDKIIVSTAEELYDYLISYQK